MAITTRNGKNPKPVAFNSKKKASAKKKKAPPAKHTTAAMIDGATGHALRRIFVTTLANDPAVSVEAGMEASRHTSVSAFRGYQVVGKTSESAKFAALGFEKK